MLIILTILAALLATAIIAFAKRRRTHLLQDSRPKHLPDASGYRPLFQPGPEELRAATREMDEQQRVAERQKIKLEHERRIDAFNIARAYWAETPSRKNTIELLYLASQCESGRTYAEAAGEIIKLWKNGQIADLSADDLSQLLESHYWLLPAQERTSGVSFSLKEELAGLRPKDRDDK